MSVVTISRQYASGGSSIAGLVATRLGWTLIDNEFIGLVAKRAGRPPEEVERCEERVEGIVDRLARTLSVAAPETFLAGGGHLEMVESAEAEIHAMTQAVLTEVTASGDVVLTKDFGYTDDAGGAVIGDFVWSDADNDGVQDPGEVGIGGVTLDLVSPGADGIFGTGDDMVADTVTTNPDGSYYFIKGTPMLFVIDKNGILRKKAIGAKQSIAESDIRDLI